MVEDASPIVKEVDPVDLIVNDVFLLEYYSGLEILNYPPADGRTSYASKRLDFYFKNNYIVRSDSSYNALSNLAYPELRIILNEKALTTKGYKASKESGSFNGSLTDFIIKRIRENFTEEELRPHLKEKFLLTPKGQKVLDDNWLFIENKLNDFEYTNEFIAKFLWKIKSKKKDYTDDQLEEMLDNSGDEDSYTDPFEIHETLSGYKRKCYTTPLYIMPFTTMDKLKGCGSFIFMAFVLFIILHIIF